MSLFIESGSPASLAPLSNAVSVFLMAAAVQIALATMRRAERYDYESRDWPIRALP
jgi:hypothetical protein